MMTHLWPIFNAIFKNLIIHLNYLCREFQLRCSEICGFIVVELRYRKAIKIKHLHHVSLYFCFTLNNSDKFDQAYMQYHAS